MNIERTATPTELVLQLPPSVRIDQAEEVRSSFLEALRAPQPLVTLDLENVEAADVTFFQLALALGQGLQDQGRHLIVRTLRPDHPAAEAAALLGLPLAHYFTQVEASP